MTRSGPGAVSQPQVATRGAATAWPNGRAEAAPERGESMYSSFDAVTDILVVAVIWVPALYLLGRAEARARATESAR